MIKEPLYLRNEEKQLCQIIRTVKEEEDFFENCYKRHTRNLLQQLNRTHLFLNKTLVSEVRTL